MQMQSNSKLINPPQIQTESRLNRLLNSYLDHLPEVVDLTHATPHSPDDVSDLPEDPCEPANALPDAVPHLLVPLGDAVPQFLITLGDAATDLLHPLPDAPLPLPAELLPPLKYI